MFGFLWVSTAIVLIPPFLAPWERVAAFRGHQRNPNPTEQLQDTSQAHRSVRPSKICPSPLGAATRPQANTCMGQVQGPGMCFLLPHCRLESGAGVRAQTAPRGRRRSRGHRGQTSAVMQALSSFPSLDRQEKNIWPYTSSFTTSAKYLYGISRRN